jgi:hypothetical protein
MRHWITSFRLLTTARILGPASAARKAASSHHHGTGSRQTTSVTTSAMVNAERAVCTAMMLAISGASARICAAIT